MSSNDSAGSTRNPVVMVIEEDDAVRALLQTALTIQGFSVLTAHDGESGLETFRRHRDRQPVVLMDVNMPGMSGPEAFRRMKEESPEVRCYFMSGDTGASEWPALMSMGALGVFGKPFASLQRLAETLRQCGRREACDNGRDSTPDS